MAKRQPPDYEIDIIMGRMADDNTFQFKMLETEEAFTEWAETSFTPRLQQNWAQDRTDPLRHSRDLIDRASVGFGKLRQQGFRVGDISWEFKKDTGRLIGVRDHDRGRFIAHDVAKTKLRDAFKLMGRR